MRSVQAFAGAGVLAFTAALASACSHARWVTVPPRVGLESYRRIGLVEFGSNSQGKLAAFTSQQFIEGLQAAQPGVAILELGPSERVLKQVGRSELDIDALKAVGEQFKVDAVFTGRLDVTDVKPRVSLATIASALSAGAEVSSSLTARLQETGGAATVWTGSSQGRETVAYVTFLPGKGARFDAKDPENAYGSLVAGMIGRITYDFQPTQRRVR